MTLRLLPILLGALAAGCRPPAEVGLLDVTLIWPLPEAARQDGDGFLRADTLAKEGALLTREVFDAIPELTRTDEPTALFDGLVVVAARLDPCFREGRNQPPCQTNVRLVLQPVLPGTGGALQARDASVHVFYTGRSEQELVDAIAALSRAREEGAAPARAVLGVHPLLTSRSGRVRVGEILAPLLGKNRLSRVTSVGVHGGNSAWTFSGFDVAAGGARTAIVIPETDGGTEQHLLSEPGKLQASVDPASTSADSVALLLDDAAAQAATLAQRQQAFDAAARIENPSLHNPGTIDCVTCHMAAAARSAALAREPLTASPDAFASTQHLLTATTNISNPQVTRALGYRFNELAISPRVVHESAAVADHARKSIK